jgi:hypothetical protein
MIIHLLKEKQGQKTGQHSIQQLPLEKEVIVAKARFGIKNPRARDSYQTNEKQDDNAIKKLGIKRLRQGLHV